MLTYNVVVEDIQSRISSYNTKSASGGPDAAFYTGLANNLQTALNNLTAIGANATQQDLIVAWQTYRESNQQRFIKMCAKNGWGIAAVIFLSGVLAGRIFTVLKEKK